MHALPDLETGGTVKAGHWTEQARHLVLVLRLQRPYLIYCMFCSLLAMTAFISTMIDLLHSHRDGLLLSGRVWRDVLEGGTWQSSCWTAVGLALWGEVASKIVIEGGALSAIRDWWCAFDAGVVVLTVVTWILTLFRRASPTREEAEEVDLWLLALRFALQPCRVLAAASMACKVQQMQQSALDISFDMLDNGVSKDHHHSECFMQ